MIAALLFATVTATRTATATKTHLPTFTPTRTFTKTLTPTPLLKSIPETSRTPRPLPTKPWAIPDVIEIDNAHTPLAFTPRWTIGPAVDYDRCGWCPVRTLTPIGVKPGDALRRHYADGTVGDVGIVVTAGPQPPTLTRTRTRTFTRTRTPTHGFTLTATKTVTPGGPTPTPGCEPFCLPTATGTPPTVTRTPTRTPVASKTPTPAPSRFTVTVQWQKNDGTTGSGTAVPYSSTTTLYWFFSSDNIELIGKVLNGCSTNGHYWFFAGGLTNVGVTITVKDNQTGAVKTYTNPVNVAFPPFQDTGAFSCP